MAAIITNKFRINNAEQFVESFSESAATTYYLFIGRAHSWATDADVQEIEEAVLADGRITELLVGKEIRKVIVIPEKMVNIVVS